MNGEYHTSTLSSNTQQYCHRCGKPTTGSLHNGYPTCDWCLNQLQPKPSETLYHNYSLVSLTEPQVRAIVREEIRKALREDGGEKASPYAPRRMQPKG